MTTTNSEPATQVDDVPAEHLPMILAALLSHLGLELVRVRVNQMPYYELREKQP